MIHSIESNIKQQNVFLYHNIPYSTRFSMWGRETIGLTLNLIHPIEKKRIAKVPVIVWLEGGAWSNTTPFLRIPELSYYGYNGFAVADVRYSVSCEQAWPAPLEDVKCAIRFLRANADKFGIDEDNIFIAGESAGAHLAALAGLTGDDSAFKTSEYADFSDKVNGVVTWYCPGTFVIPENRNKELNAADPLCCLVHKYIYDDPELMESVSPISYVKENCPPFLMYHGDRDTLVDVKCSVALHDALVQRGNNAELYIIQGASHASPEFSQPEIHEKMLAFFRENLK